MKTFILISSLLISLSASAKVMVCDTEIISDRDQQEAIDKGLEPTPEAKQSFRFDLDKKGNFLISGKEVSSQLNHYSFGVNVVNNRIQNIWAMNLDGRAVSGTDGNSETLEHNDSSDGINFKVKCQIQ